MIVLYEWMWQAACKGKSKIFFPESYDSRRYRGVDSSPVIQAKAICRTCPVQVQCREVFYDEPYGIVAGLTPRERGFILRTSGKVSREVSRPRRKGLISSEESYTLVV